MSAPIRDRRQLVTGLSLSVLSVGIFFWWGLHFGVFGKKITNDLPTFGFLVWIVVAALGFGYAVGGWRVALLWAGALSIMFAVAGLLGVVLGNSG